MINNAFTDRVYEYKVRERFEFVKEVILHENICIYANYALTQYFSETITESPPIVQSMHYKTITIYAAQVAEAVIFYTVKKLEFNKDFIKFIPKETVDKKVSNLELPKLFKFIEYTPETPNKFDLNLVISHKKYKKIDKNIKFNTTIKMISDYCGSQPWCASAKKLQVIRNKIHLNTLANVDDVYTKESVNTTFKDLAEVIDGCKTLLSN